MTPTPTRDSRVGDERLAELDNFACDQLARNPDGLWQEMSAQEARSILTELQRRRSLDTADGVEPVAYINGQGGVLMTEAGEKWFAGIRAKLAPVGSPAAPLFATPVSAEVTEALENAWHNFINCRNDPSGDKAYDEAEEQRNVLAIDAALTKLIASINGGRENG